MTFGLHLALISLFPVALIVAALRDVTSYTIPNWLTGALALAFFPAAIGLGVSPAAIGLSAGLGVAALAGTIALFAMNFIGGGDAKLFAASAMWLGWPAFASFVVWTAIAGGGLAAALLMARRTPIPFAAQAPAWIGRLLEPKGDVPYGVAIAAGALAAFPASGILHGLGVN